MAGDTRGPDAMGGEIRLSLGAPLLDDVDAWARARGKKRAPAIRALVALALDVAPTHPVDTPRRASLALRRAQLVRELAEIDAQLDDDDARGRLTWAAYLWHRADHTLVQEHYTQ